MFDGLTVDAALTGTWTRTVASGTAVPASTPLTQTLGVGLLIFIALALLARRRLAQL